MFCIQAVCAAIPKAILEPQMKKKSFGKCRCFFGVFFLFVFSFASLAVASSVGTDPGVPRRLAKRLYPEGYAQMHLLLASSRKAHALDPRGI